MTIYYSSLAVLAGGRGSVGWFERADHGPLWHGLPWDVAIWYGPSLRRNDAPFPLFATHDSSSAQVLCSACAALVACCPSHICVSVFHTVSLVPVAAL